MAMLKKRLRALRVVRLSSVAAIALAGADCGGSKPSPATECPAIGLSPGPDQPMGDASGLAALPANSFVFSKVIRRASPAGWYSHLYAFDMLSRQERLISTLDDDGVTGASLTGIAVSPDRRWIAFTAENFRREGAEKELMSDAVASLWLISVDGVQFRRLAPPLALDETCVVDDTCRKGFSSKMYHPTFHPDGAMVYYSHNTIRPLATGDFAYSWRLARVPISGGPPSFLTEPAGCSNPAAPSIHPSGRSLVAVQSCGDGLGLYERNLDPVSLRDALFRGRLGSVPAAWTRDGTTAFFGVVVEPSGPLDFMIRYGLFAWDTCEREGRVVFTAPDGAEVSSPSVSPDSKTVVVEMRNYPPSSDWAFDLYSLDPASTTLTRLTHDGNSRSPRW